jgi:hypothetical protein
MSSPEEIAEALIALSKADGHDDQGGSQGSARIQGAVALAEPDSPSPKADIGLREVWRVREKRVRQRTRSIMRQLKGLQEAMRRLTAKIKESL